MKIEKATLKDIKTIVELNNKCLVKEDDNGFLLIELTYDKVHELLDKSVFLLLKDKGEAIGFIQGSIIEDDFSDVVFKDKINF